jgi:hypothetical protein
MDMVADKIAQAVANLNDKNIDAWLTFVRESATMPDPPIDCARASVCPGGV